MEVWKDVIGFEDSYQISTEGNRKLAKMFGINHTIVWGIKNELAYKHLWESNKLAA